MPVVPVEQNRVGIAEVSGAKFRAPDTGGGVGDALAVGGARIAGAVAEYAITQDEIQDHADKLAARNLAMEYKAEAAKKAAEFKSLKGVNAVNSSAQFQADMDGLKSSTLSRAANPRQRAYLDPFIGEAHPDFMNGIADHSRREQFDYSNETYASEAKAAANRASELAGEPDKQLAAFAEGDAAIERMGRLNGWSEVRVSEKKLEMRSASHLQALDSMLAVEDPDIYQAEGYLEQHKAEMLPAHYNAARKDMQKPLQWRQAQEDIAGIEPVTEPDGTAAPGVTVTSGYDPGSLKAKIRGPESGGNDRAINQMGSTASGRYQFTKGTFVSLYNRVYGGGGEGAWEKNRFDVNVQERLMDRLLSDNTKALQNAGLPVNDGNLYVLHVLGPGDGIKVLKANPDTPVSALLSPEVIKGNPTYFGNNQTARGSAAIIASKVGGKVDTSETPRGWDKAAAYDAIDARAKAEGWSPERTERAKEAMDVKIGRDEQMLARQQRDADDDALEMVVGMGDNFTSLNQIPRATRDKMSPEMRARLQQNADNNLARKNTVPDDTNDAMYLKRLAREYPDQFANVDLGQYVGKISQKDMGDLWLRQGDIKGQQRNRTKPDISSGISGAITLGQKYSGAKINDKDWPAYYDAMEAYLALRYEKNGKLEPEDYDQAFRWAHRTQGNNTKPGAIVLRDNIPPEFEADFRKNWKGKNPPRRSDIIKGYIQWTTGR